MEEPKKTLGHRHTNKTAVKIRAGSPIGAVLVLGGALATATFVSAFIRRRRWGSGKDKDRRHQHKNPRQELGKRDELDGTKKGEDFAVLCKSSSAEEHPLRNGETKMIEHEDTTDSLTQGVKKVTFEINGGDEVIPRLLENGSEEPEDTVPEGIITKLPSIENDELNVITKGSNGFDIKFEARPDIVDDPVSLGDQANCLKAEDNLIVQENDSVEEKSEVVIEKIEDGVAEIRKEQMKEGQKQEADADPLLGTHAVVEYEAVNGHEYEGSLATKNVDIVQVDEVVDGSHGDGMECAKDELVETQEKRDQEPVDIIVSKSCEGEACGSNPQNEVQILVLEKAINYENMDGNTCTNPMVESHVSYEVETEENGEAVNDAVSENQEVNEQVVLLVDRNSVEEIVEANKLASLEIMEVKENNTTEEVEKIEYEIVTTKDNIIMPTNNGNNMDSKNAAEENSKEMTTELILQEAEYKTQEDTTAATKEKEKENGSSFRPNGVEMEECNSKTKYVLNLAKLKGGQTVVITLLSVLSSISCSWYFGLSLVKLCAILFLTMVLSKLHS